MLNYRNIVFSLLKVCKSSRVLTHLGIHANFSEMKCRQQGQSRPADFIMFAPKIVIHLTLLDDDDDLD